MGKTKSQNSFGLKVCPRKPVGGEGKSQEEEEKEEEGRGEEDQGMESLFLGF